MRSGDTLSLAWDPLHEGATTQGNELNAKLHIIRCMIFPLLCILILVCTVYSSNEVMKNEQTEAE